MYQYPKQILTIAQQVQLYIDVEMEYAEAQAEISFASGAFLVNSSNKSGLFNKFS